MINKFQKFFRKHMDLAGIDAVADSASHEHTMRVCAGALLIETMVADGHVTASEESRIKALLSDSFQLSADETDELLDLAKSEAADATSLFQFTTLVNAHYAAAQKFDLLKQIWQVALADGKLDKHEEGFIRKLAELLHIRHSDFIRAKHLARELPI